MELELKHLAPYLPYQLNCYDSIRGLSKNKYSTVEVVTKGFGNSRIGIDHVLGSKLFTPILRPLSQLTQEITHNGDTFVPIEYLDMYAEDLRVMIKHDVMQANMRWHDAQKLVEWHFDVFNLIEHNLAIEKPNH